MQEYDVPVQERVQVEAGDCVGFHYDDTGSKALVRNALANNDPGGNRAQHIFVMI